MINQAKDLDPEQLRRAAPDLYDALNDLLGQVEQGAVAHEITINSPSAQRAIARAILALQAAGGRP